MTNTPNDKEDAWRFIVRTASRHTARSDMARPDVPFSELNAQELLDVIHDFEKRYDGFVTDMARIAYDAARLMFVARMLYNEKENTSV